MIVQTMGGMRLDLGVMLCQTAAARHHGGLGSALLPTAAGEVRLVVFLNRGFWLSQGGITAAGRMRMNGRECLFLPTAGGILHGGPSDAGGLG